MALLLAAGSLAIGLGEVATRLVVGRFGSDPVFFDPQSVWMAPLSMALLLALPMSAAWALGWRIGAERAIAWAGAACVAIGLYEFLLLAVPRLHPAAHAIICLAVARQAVWLAVRWPRGVVRTAKTLLIGCAAMVAIATAWRIARVAFGEGRAIASASGPASADLPNVILLILDTVRASELSGYGYPRRTSPFLDSLASTGIRFSNAVATSSWTLPSHASIFTGRYPFELSTNWNVALDRTHATVAEVMRDRGWATAGFSANLRYVGTEYGLGRGFDHFRSYARSFSQLARTTMVGRQIGGTVSNRLRLYWRPGRKTTSRVVSEFLDWRARVGGRRYFAFLNVFDSHEPYAPPAPFDMAFATREPVTREIAAGTRFTGDTLAGLRDAYDGALAWTDDQLRQLFDGLLRSGDLGRTFVVITADHGEEFAEHGHVSHGNGLHFPSLHVPLIVIDPRRQAPLTVDGFVTLRDMAATLVARTGPSDPRIPGRPLTVHWDEMSARARAASPPSSAFSEVYQVKNQPDWYPASRGDLKSVVIDSFHLILGPGKNEELYNLRRDPLERLNLLPDTSFALVAEKARMELARIPDRLR